MGVQWLGNLVDRVGTVFGLPEGSWSESIAGGRTSNTGYDSRTGGSSYYAPPVARYPEILSPQVSSALVSSGNKKATANATYIPSSGGGTNVPNQVQQTPDNGSNYNYDAINALRSSVNNAYDPVFQQLDSMAGLIPTWKTEKEGTVNSMYNNQAEELGVSKKGALDTLDTYRTEVGQRQAKSVRQLNQNMQKMLQAGNVYLGTAGAGDSSAAKMYAFALSKAAGQGAAEISDNASSQYNDLNVQQSNVQTTFDTNMSQLKQWKDSELNKVSEWANTQLLNIQNAKASATGQKAQALASMEQGVIQQALSYLQSLDSQATNWASQMQTWAINRMASIDDAKIKLGQQAQYNVQDIIAPQLAGINSPIASNVNSQYVTANPYTMALRKKTDEFGNLINTI